MIKKPEQLDPKKLPLTVLEADPENPNHMEAEQIAQLAKAIDTFGFLQPALVRRLAPTPEGHQRYRIIDGHHRAQAAGMIGMASIPCVIVDTDEEAAALLKIGMNKLRGELNLGDVAKVIAELEATGWTVPELEVTGFTKEEITNLLEAVKVPTDDDVMAGAVAGTSSEEPPAAEAGGPFELTIEFGTKEELQRAKRGLRRAAGKGRELGEGLLSLLKSQD